jgi:hypothetical protein
MRDKKLSASDHNYLAYRICENLLGGIDGFVAKKVAFASRSSINSRHKSLLFAFSAATFYATNSSIPPNRFSHITCTLAATETPPFHHYLQDK